MVISELECMEKTYMCIYKAYLLSHVPFQDMHTALHCAAAAGHVAGIAHFLNHGTDVDDRNTVSEVRLSYFLAPLSVLC